MNTQITKEVESDQQVLYVPSEVERKKVLVMYLLFGIIISITKESLSSYEYSHLKQATGRWLLSCFFFIVSMVLVFIPFLNILPFLVALGLLGVWSICVYHARHGKFAHQYSSPTLQWLVFLSSLGNWLYNIFDIQFRIQDS